MVWRTELLVVLKEQGSVGLFDLAGRSFLLFFCQLLRFGLVQSFSDTRVVWRHHPFGNRKLSCLFGFPHGDFGIFFLLLFNGLSIFDGMSRHNLQKLVRYSIKIPIAFLRRNTRNGIRSQSVKCTIKKLTTHKRESCFRQRGRMTTVR
jgi:hypothetical protein